MKVNGVDFTPEEWELIRLSVQMYSLALGKRIKAIAEKKGPAKEGAGLSIQKLKLQLLLRKLTRREKNESDYVLRDSLRNEEQQRQEDREARPGGGRTQDPMQPRDEGIHKGSRSSL